jgi:hypothetical protein
MGGRTRVEVDAMHATFRQHGHAGGGRGVQGTFYPNEAQAGPGSIGAALPKLLAILVAVIFVRTVLHVAKQHGAGSSHRSRRREAIAELHRELHAQDASSQTGEATKG